MTDRAVDIVEHADGLSHLRWENAWYCPASERIQTRW